MSLTTGSVRAQQVRKGNDTDHDLSWSLEVSLAIAGRHDSCAGVSARR